MLKDHKRIETWIREHTSKEFTIHPDGTIDVRGNVSFKWDGNTLPVQFGRIEGSFNVNDSTLTSFVGFPHYVQNVVYCSRTNIRSLHGVEKAVKYVGDTFFCTGNLPTHMLGLLLIEGITNVRIDDVDKKGNSNEVLQRIINKHIGGKGDILVCQDELIDAGFIDQARW
jgi:hypothetical protein